MPVPVPEGYWSAFTVACFIGLQTSSCARLDIELQWLAITDVQLAGNTHDLILVLAIDLAGPQLGPKSQF